MLNDSMLALFIVIGIVVALLVIVAVWLIVAYNKLVQLGRRVENAWGAIQTQLQHRADLAPTLVSTVQGHATEERDAFERVTEARAASVNAAGPAEAAAAEPELARALRGVYAVAEKHPELQSSGNFMQLQQELTDTEDRVQAARRVFNSTVREYNTKIRSFPNTLFVRGLGYRQREFFEVDDPGAVAEPPRIQF